MTTIKLVYSEKTTKHAKYIERFFNIIGVYVCKQYTVDIRNEIHAIGLVTRKEWQLYDATIALFDNKVDIDEEIKNSESTIVYSYDNNLTELEIIDYILTRLKDLKIIKTSEYNYILKIKEIIFGKEYFPVIMINNELCSDQHVDKVVKLYRSMIDKLIDTLKEFGVETWGTNKAERIQFASAYLSYDLNIFCKKNKKSLEISPESIVKLCKLFDKFTDDSLKISVMMLEAQTQIELLNDVHKGYAILDSLSFDKELFANEHNSLVFYIKCKYWLNDADNPEIAKKNIIRALSINSSDYRYWYTLGVIYYKLDDRDMALISFGAVIKLLRHGLKNNSLQIYEIKYLVTSYKTCGSIYYKLNNIRDSLEYYKKAIETYNKIGSNSFYIDSDTVDNIKENTEKSIDILYIDEKLKELERLAILTGV